MRRLLLTAAILAVGAAAGLGLVRGVSPSAAVAAPPPGHEPEEPEEPAMPERLAPPPALIDESSGLAASRERPGWLWTHNDSAGGQKIARYDPTGEGAAEAFTVAGARNLDWEDVAAFELHGRRFLLIADTGDNTRSRADARLHFLEEPPAHADPATPLGVLLSVPIAYADGARDCEAVAVDTTRGLVLLGSKEIDQRGRTHGASGLYQLPLPALPAAAAGSTPAVTLDRVAVLPTMMPTGMDVSADGSRLVICTYGDAMLFACPSEESWSGVVGGEPERLRTPPRRQGEAVAFSLDGRSLFFTSEGENQPTWRLPIQP